MDTNKPQVVKSHDVQLGRDLVQKKAEERWGSGVVEQVSLDLQAAFPESKGFSTTNLYYMKQWYLFYCSEPEKLHQLGGKLQGADKQVDIKLQQVVGEIDDTKLSQLGREIKLPQDAGETKFQQAVGELSEGVPFPMAFALVPGDTI